MAVGHVRPHFFEIDVGFRFHLLTFWAAIVDVRFWSPAFMRTFLRTCQPKRLLQRLRAIDCGVRFISRLKYKIQAWRHVYDNLCIRLSLALVEAVLKKLALGK
jgi:hypothetical protein